MTFPESDYKSEINMKTLDWQKKLNPLNVEGGHKVSRSISQGYPFSLQVQKNTYIESESCTQ